MSPTFEDNRTTPAPLSAESDKEVASSPVSQRGPLRRFINRLEVDQATFYALCLRGWQLLAGPVSILLIARFFAPEVQGYYYTFASLLAMQTFFDLGLYIVIINVSSHEWSSLTLDASGRIQGDPEAQSRLVSLGRWLFGWYSIAAVLFAICVGTGGGWFLAHKDYGPIPWQVPWIVLAVLSAVTLWQLPFVTLLEGCGQMPVVNRYRFYQAVTGSLVVWSCMALGAGLWTPVAAAAVQVVWHAILILVRYRKFFHTFHQPPPGPRISWQTELWPMQWRLAVSAVVSYFAFSLFTPVMFKYFGPAVAGQMGMTWQLTTVLQAVALAWVHARTPLFGQLIAKQDYPELDRVFFRLAQVSFAVVLIGGVVLELAVLGVHWSGIRLAQRLLPPLPTAMLILGVIFYHIPNCQALYIRAHKRDPLFPISVAASVLIGTTVWWFGSREGPMGAATAYLAVVAGFVLPFQTFIWWQCRRAH